MTTLSTNLKRLRINAELMQWEIAEEIGVRQRTYEAWENRGIEPKVKHLLHIARFYNVTVDDLISKDLILNLKV